MANPLEADPMKIILNDEGDVVVPVEAQIPRAKWAENRQSLEEDHPAFAGEPMLPSTGEIPTEPMNETDKAVLQGIQTAKQFIEDPDSFGADWPSAQMDKQARENQEAAPKTERAVLGSRAKDVIGSAPAGSDQPVEIAPLAPNQYDGRTGDSARRLYETDQAWLKGQK